MTGNNDKLRSLFLTALMVMSVFAMTVAVSAPAAANHANDDSDADVHLESNERFWGQVVWLNADDDTTYELWSVDDGSADEFIDSIHTNENGTATYDTLDLDSGQYVVRTQGGDNVIFSGGYENETGNITDARFSVTVQSLNTTFDDDSVENDATTELTIDSNRGVYNLTVDAGGDLSASDLQNVFDDVSNDIALNSDDDEIQINRTSDDDYTANFTDIDEGDYEFNFEVTDTGASDSASINVTEAGEGGTEFDEGVVQEHIGDVASIPVTLENTEDATVAIGSDDNGYTAVAEVSDGSGDGEVVLEFNTYAAGANTTNATVVEVADGDDSLESFEQHGLSTDVANESILDTGNYDMNVSVGHDGVDDPSDQGTLSLQERSTEELTAWTSPVGEFDGDSDPSEFWGAVGESLTEDDTITHHGDVVLALEATGIEGAMADDNSSLSFAVDHLNPGMNQEANNLNLTDSANASMVEDPANDTYFIIVHTDAVGDQYSDGNEYEANFSVNEDSVLASDGAENVYAEYEFADAEASLDTQEVDGEDLVVVQNEENQTISGDTNIAPGTDLQIHISSDDRESPFLITTDATVQEDGTFEATTNEFSEVGLGANFTATVRLNNNPIGGEEFSGQVLEAQEDNETTPTPTEEEPTPTETEEPTPTETEEPDDEETPTPDEGGDETPTEEEGPGFGVAVGLIALIGAALLAARRQN